MTEIQDKQENITQANWLKQVKAWLPLLKFYGRALLKGSWLIIGLAALLGWYLRARKLSSPTYYTATLSFSLSESKGFQDGLVSSLLGFSGASTSEQGGTNAVEVEELLGTRRVMQMALFRRLSFKQSYDKPKEDFLVNHYLGLSGLRANWAGTELANFSFKHDSLEAFSRTENQIFQMVFQRISASEFRRFRNNSGTINLSYQSVSEELAYEFVLALYESIDSFYTEKAVEKQRKVYEAAVKRRDALEARLQQDEADYYGYLDVRNAPGTNEVHVRKFAKQKKLMTTMEAYFLAIKNAEAAGMALEQKTPILQLIDPPMYPLSAAVPNPNMHLYIGIFAGGFLGLLIVLGYVFGRQIMLRFRQA